MGIRRKSNKKIVRMKRRSNRVAKFGGFLLLVVVTLLVLMLTPFFNVKWIDIQGANKVTGGEIKTAIQYNTGENVFKIRLRKSKQALLALPYVETAEVHRKLPDGIRVKITEREPCAYAAFGGSFVLIDKDGRLLEQVKTAPKKIPLIDGAVLKGLSIGQALSDKDEERAQAFSVLYEKLNEYDLYARTTELNIKNTDNLGFVYDGNKTVVIGDGYRLDYKLMMLQVALDELAPSEKGTITLTVEGKAIFTPAEEQ